jgi:hypothetical protein
MKCGQHNHVKRLLLHGVYCLSWLPIYSQIPEPEKPRSPEFAARFEQVTNALTKLISELPNKVAVPKNWDGSIKYYRSISSSFYRVMEHGSSHGMPDNVAPMDGQPYFAFYFDPNDHLRFTVDHSHKAEPYVSGQILYRDKEPFARLSYTEAGWELIDFVHYEKASPVISCRLLKDEKKIVLIEEIKENEKTQKSEKSTN